MLPGGEWYQGVGAGKHSGAEGVKVLLNNLVAGTKTKASKAILAKLGGLTVMLHVTLHG